MKGKTRWWACGSCNQVIGFDLEPMTHICSAGDPSAQRKGMVTPCVGCFGLSPAHSEWCPLAAGSASDPASALETIGHNSTEGGACAQNASSPEQFSTDTPNTTEKHPTGTYSSWAWHWAWECVHAPHLIGYNRIAEPVIQEIAAALQRAHARGVRDERDRAPGDGTSRDYWRTIIDAHDEISRLESRVVGDRSATIPSRVKLLVNAYNRRGEVLREATGALQEVENIYGRVSRALEAVMRENKS